MKRLLRPWRTPTMLWRHFVFVVLSLVTGVVSFTVMVTLLAVSVGLFITFFLALPTLWLLFVSSEVLAGAERSRLRDLLGIDIVRPSTTLVAASWIGRVMERVRSKQRWQMIGYQMTALPVGFAGFAAVTTTWSGGLAFLALPLYVKALPGDSAKFYVFELSGGTGSVIAAMVGVAIIAVVAPHLTQLVSRWQASIASRLLGPCRGADLAAQVSRLETSRSAAVDGAETERRRIERDLHDGAQQRLVALAAGLGAAKEKLDEDPEQGRAMVAVAHEEAKAALKEIRNLVRGIHPVILEDRGLDAALSAVVARAPVPVELTVRLDPRPTPAVESAAYFVVNETLTNVARHARATRAWVAVDRVGDRLVLEISDDGIGGADASRGTGLQGLRERVTALGGTMHVISPKGGPTTISVEMQCGS